MYYLPNTIYGAVNFWNTKYFSDLLLNTLVLCKVDYFTPNFLCLYENGYGYYDTVNIMQCILEQDGLDLDHLQLLLLRQARNTKQRMPTQQVLKII